MRILYFSPEHISGTLRLFQTYHRKLGDDCRYLTMFQNLFGFEEDICLNLPASPSTGWFAYLKEVRRKILAEPVDPERVTPPGKPPLWQPDGMFSSFVFKTRELLWTPYVRNYEKKYDLLSYDLYQFDMGIEFFRDGRWVKKLKQLKKHLLCFYHGTDVRNRGVIKEVDDACDLHLSSELDLLFLHPKLRYLFLPIDMEQIHPVAFDDKPNVIRIGHSARNRTLKGTEAVIRACHSLKRKGYQIELVLIENVPHSEAMRLKESCHIAVDQLTDLGGWGYGMSSLEFLCLGIPVITKMRPEYIDFLPDHPYVSSDETSIEQSLELLIQEPELRMQKRTKGFSFMQKYHSLPVVMRQLYDYYFLMNWIQQIPKELENVKSPLVRAP